MKRYRLFQLFLLISLALASPSWVGADPCFSTLSADMKIQVPAIKLADTFIEAEFELLTQGPAGEGGAWLQLQEIRAGNLLNCSNPAVFFQDNATDILRIPLLQFNGDAFWVDLAYTPTSDNKVWLKLLAAGLMSNQVFVTSVTGDGNLGGWPEAGGKTGLAAGDAICQARATAAGLKGTFIAWLSDTHDDAYCRIHSLTGKKSSNCGQAALPVNAGPWVRTDGYPFSGSIAELLNSGKVFVPVTTNEFGAPLDDTRWYRTGTKADGTVYDRDGAPCGDWTSGADIMVAGGVSDFTSFAWTISASNSCTGTEYTGLACFQAGAGPPLPNFALPGKKAFLTSVTGSGDLGTWPDAHGLTGIAAGDEICRTRATSAGIQNAKAFKAWLSDSSTDAIDRFTSNGPWVRLDGVLVAENRADLTDGLLNTTVNLTETGEYIGFFYYVWTGTNSAGKKTSDTCDGWTNGTSSFNGSSGRTFDRSGWTYSGYPQCDLTGQMHLYCFED